MGETIKERGFFWWFNETSAPARSQATSIPGLLTITDQGEITLETDGALCQEQEYQNWSEPRNFPESRRIAGLVASSDNRDSYVLLESLERTDLSFSDESPQRQQFSAQLCASRDSPFPETYPEGFTELRIPLDGFEEWLELESIVVDREYSGGDTVKVLVTYKEWRFEYPVARGSIFIESITTGTLPFFSNLPTTSAEFRQHYYLVFRPDPPSDALSLRDIYTKIEELLAVLIGTYHRLPWPIFTTRDELNTWNTTYFYRDTPPRRVNRFSMWIPFVRIRETLGDLLRNWIAKSESFGAGYYLYVSALRNPHQYSEHRFVNLVWGVEALHRKWLGESETSEHVVNERKRVKDIVNSFPEDSDDRKWLREKLANAHELSLRNRILECFRKLPITFGKGELEKFAKACADRRNDISHAGGPRKNVDYDSFHSEISRLAEALDALFHMLLLYHIGIEASVIAELVTDSLVSQRVKTALANAGLTIDTGDPAERIQDQS